MSEKAQDSPWVMHSRASYRLKFYFLRIHRGERFKYGPRSISGRRLSFPDSDILRPGEFLDTMVVPGVLNLTKKTENI